MKDQLMLLEELQRHDARIQELQKARQAIPAKLDDMRLDLKRVGDILEQERTQLAETEKWRQEKDEERKAEEGLLQRAKSRVGQVKNAKEYMASQREVETTRKLAAETEEKLKAVNEAAAQFRERIAAHESDLEKLRRHVAGEEQAAAAKLAKLEGEIAGLQQGREAAASRVRPEVLKKYSTIRLRRGLAVVAVVGGRCTGCNMNIPPQLYNILQRGNSIEACPNCHRIIYWAKLMENPDGEAYERPAPKE